MKTVRLHGELAELFGSHHRFDIRTPAEAVRALLVNYAGFEKHVLQNTAVVYKVMADEVQVGAEELCHPVSQEVHIIPVFFGAGTPNQKFLVGAVLIVAGVAVNYFSGGSLAWIGNPMISMGIGFALGGVAQLLTPVPKVSIAGPAERPDNKPSYVFNGPVNTTAQGQPVPIGYGRLIVGGAVISAGIAAEEIQP